LFFFGNLGHSESVYFKKNGFPDQDNRGSKFGSNKKVCTYCNKIGHTIDVFYKKHGYPLWYRSQYGKSSQSNNISTTIQEENFGNQDQNKQNNKGDFRITQHQYQILLDLLKNVNNSNNQVQVNQVGPLSADHQDQNLAVTSNIQKLQNSNFNEYTWVVDFGDTDHVCFSLSNFTSYKHIKPITIKLPNGNSVIVSCSSTIFFNKKIILENVLYVPDFSFNLISIFQLTASLKCELIFSSTECLIQNSRTKDKIGTIDFVVGLYVFNKTDSRIMSCTAKQSNIWHLRMGNP